jgi:hypothetical protein
MTGHGSRGCTLLFVKYIFEIDRDIFILGKHLWNVIDLEFWCEVHPGAPSSARPWIRSDDPCHYHSCKPRNLCNCPQKSQENHTKFRAPATTRNWSQFKICFPFWLLTTPIGSWFEDWGCISHSTKRWHLVEMAPSIQPLAIAGALKLNCPIGQFHS